MIHVLFYALLRTFFKTVGELLHILTVHPKLIFWAAIKKTLMVPEDRSYQTQYFTEIFPLALTLHINVYLHLQESSENAL